ncbi:MAG: prephenate dehydrogenase/arogenate dehydrogenase family protein [Chloroflexota bacterium]|nr:prephenate dehydrogenase/arogenate dehydrogenase family protein [Chloroflexota bacterium]
MQQVVIVGLGLIGGSIGLGLKRWSAEQSKSGSEPLQIIGFDTDLEQQNYAKKLNAVDKTEWRLPNAIAEADIVVLCTPVREMRELLADMAQHLKPGTIVTDVGSTKADVITWADELLPETTSFIGGHPMAGKAMSIEGADADLFKGATWCVTPSVKAEDGAVRNVLGMITALGADAYFVDPHEHDSYVAGISHLPFVLSATLTKTLGSDSSWKDMKSLTAGGFRDMTRLAAGSAAMHRDILITNKDAVLRWIDQFQRELSNLRETIADDANESREEELTKFFEGARDIRAEWATQTTREGELLQKTGSDLAMDSVGDQVSRMFFGSLFKRRMQEAERLGRKGRRGVSAQGSKDHSSDNSYR